MLSVAEYLRVGGDAFSGTGITPDVEKSLDEEQAALLARRQLAPENDAQVQAAVTALVQQGAAVTQLPGSSSQDASPEPAESGESDASSTAEGDSSSEPSSEAE